MADYREAAKAIADLVFVVSGQLIVGDEMRKGMIEVIQSKYAEGFKAGQEAMRERAAAEFDADVIAMEADGGARENYFEICQAIGDAKRIRELAVEEPR